MNIGVIGSGAIGPDLAYGFVSALAKAGGGRVYLLDIRQDALDAGMKRINGYVMKGPLPPQPSVPQPEPPSDRLPRW